MEVCWGGEVEECCSDLLALYQLCLNQVYREYGTLRCSCKRSVRVVPVPSRASTEGLLDVVHEREHRDERKAPPNALRKANRDDCVAFLHREPANPPLMQ